MKNPIAKASKSSTTNSKMIRFDKVEVREYPIILSDNPTPLSGPAIGIDWHHDPESTVSLDVDQYELSKEEGSTRSKGELVMPPDLRRDMLLRAGYSALEVDEAEGNEVKNLKGDVQEEKVEVKDEVEKKEDTAGVAKENVDDEHTEHTQHTEHTDTEHTEHTDHSDHHTSKPKSVNTHHDAHHAPKGRWGHHFHIPIHHPHMIEGFFKKVDHVAFGGHHHHHHDHHHHHHWHLSDYPHMVEARVEGFLKKLDTVVHHHQHRHETSSDTLVKAKKCVRFDSEVQTVEPIEFDWSTSHEVWYTPHELNEMSEARLHDAEYLRKQKRVDSSSASPVGPEGSTDEESELIDTNPIKEDDHNSNNTLDTLLTQAFSDPDIDPDVSIRGIEHFVYPSLKEEMIHKKKLVQSEVLEFVKLFKEGKTLDPQGWRLARHSRELTAWASDVALEKGMRWGILKCDDEKSLDACGNGFDSTRFSTTCNSDCDVERDEVSSRIDDDSAVEGGGVGDIECEREL